MKILYKILIILFIILGGTLAEAYELATHGRLTYEAYRRSVLADTSFIQQLGLDNGKEPFGISYYDVSGAEVKERTRNLFEQQKERMPKGTEPLSIEGWLMRGAIREDDLVLPWSGNPQDDEYGNFIRVYHHFFDPVNNLPLNGVLTPLSGTSVHTAPAWALGTTNANAFGSTNTAEDGRRNHFTIQDAREAMYRALTGLNKAGDVVAALGSERKAYWATTFRALGDVVHLMQDMGQPQHTRNDPHNEDYGYGATVYEEYTNMRALQREFACVNALGPSTPPAIVYGNYPPPTFNQYSDFFSTRDSNIKNRKGLADFSNREFFSAGTNLARNSYPYPSDNEADYTQVDFPKSLPCISPLFAGKPVLLLGNVLDALNAGYPDTPTNSYPGNAGKVSLTTRGLFDVPAFNINSIDVSMKYAMTEYNYEDMADLLIPRAVAYSAGLVNYFFRGKLAAENISVTDTTISLNVKNTTEYDTDPQNPVEIIYSKDSQLNPGKFVIAVMYKQGGQSQVITSAPMTFSTDISPGATSNEILTFTFQTPVPADATDVEWRLVFRGRIGNEDDAIAVGLIEPFSGIIVTPNHLPADGIAGSRLIYPQGGLWQVSNSSGMVFGNIDWKGRYVNGVPTKVLSWSGPQTRYYPGNGDFGNEIYQNGEVYATAPYPVLGAALTRDSQAAEWLIAVCKMNTDVVVYQRLASDPGAVWQELGVMPLPTDAQLNAPDTPWFFNGNGNEAQAIFRGVPSGGTTGVFYRYKLTVNDGVVSFQNLGYGSTTSRSIWSQTVGTGSVNRDHHSETTPYIVAVDYKDGQEVFARMEWWSGLKYTKNVQITNEWKGDWECGNVVYNNRSLSGTHNGEEGERTTILFGGNRIDLTRNMSLEIIRAGTNRETAEYHLSPEGPDCDATNLFGTHSYHRYGNASSSYSAPVERISRSIIFQDLRADLLVYEENKEIEDSTTNASGKYDNTQFFVVSGISSWESYHIATGWTINNLGAQRAEPDVTYHYNTSIIKSNKQRISVSGISKTDLVVINESTNTPFRYSENITRSLQGVGAPPSPRTIGIGGNEEQPYYSESNDTLSVKYPAIKYLTGSWVVDRNHNVFISQSYTDKDGVIKYINYLDDGDPVQLLGITGTDPHFYPAGMY